MRKAAAVLLAGCVTLQTVLGGGATVSGADLFQDGSAPSWETAYEPENEAFSETEMPETVPVEEPEPDLILDEGSSDAEEWTLSEDLEEVSMEEEAEEVEDAVENPEEAAEASEEELFSHEEEMMFLDGQEAEETSGESASHTAEGAIEVQLTSALPFKKETQVAVSIRDLETEDNDKDKVIGHKNVIMHDNDGDEKGASFTGLKKGRYSVTLKASGFADYCQEVSVEEGMTSKIHIYSAKTWEDGQSQHPGVFFAGDVTGDAKIDDQDKRVLVQALHEQVVSGDVSSVDPAWDIDGDGKINLADLQYLAISLGKGTIHSTVEKSLSPDSVFAVQDEGTVITGEGGAEALLTQEGSALLKRRTNNEPITPDTPVGVSFTLAEKEEEARKIGGMVIQAPVEMEGIIENDIKAGKVTVAYVENQTEKEMEIDIATGEVTDKEASSESQEQSQQAPEFLAFAAGLFTGTRTVLAAPAATVKVGADGSLTFDFGKQIAVKRVSIRITGTTKKEEPLVHITKVEFLNDMQNRIPAPELNVPDGLTVEKAQDREIELRWTQQRNVTGYEVKVSGETKKETPEGSQEKTPEEIIRVSVNAILLKAINGEQLLNGKTYTFQVRSVNGDWKSPWSEPVTAAPIAVKPPAAPDSVNAAGLFRSVKVSWKAMDNTDAYMVYYREKGEETFRPVGDLESGRITGNSYSITGLKDETTYEVCVTGWNEVGWGPASLTAQAVTRADEPRLSGYRLLNTSNGKGALTSHIQEITYINGGMYNSPLDQGGSTAYGLADASYESYWQYDNWDDGGFNGGYHPTSGNVFRGICVRFDQAYDMNYITFSAAGLTSDYRYLQVYYEDEETQEKKRVDASLTRYTDDGNNPCYRIKLSPYVHTSWLHICLGIDYYTHPYRMQIGEMRFYHYDTLEEDIFALYADDSCTSLKPEVTMETLTALEERLNTPDEQSGDLHHEYRALKTELERAKDIFSGNLDEPIEVKTSITSKRDGHLGFSGLNAWQPLGRTAAAGETLLVYVGNNKQKVGASTSLSLIATQYHSEVSGLQKSYQLKVGRNEIRLDSLNSMGQTEKGGQLYIAYNGNNDNDNYVVRVRGGRKIPVLSLYGLTGEERSAAVLDYVTELGAYVETLQAGHEEYCNGQGSGNKGIAYDEKNCILNATDLMLDQMLYSLPATQVWNSLNAGESLQAKAQILDASLKAMDDTMTLFYQHKGLTASGDTSKGSNAMPSGHLNIRYMRMFAGAFMYAAGNHIGIEWTETPILGNAAKAADFGWGIAHEIGHNINQGTYAVAEVTNNYFAQLLTGTERYDMNEVYRKVTSGTTGAAENVFTALAMYWQLHLAYDNSADDHAVYSDYEQQFANLFFARVDTYARNPGKAPGELTLTSNAYQNLMRLSCAAAERNLLPFFERWGLVPDSGTISYGNTFPAEERAIYYVNGDARNYRAANQESEAALTVRGKDVVTASSQTIGANGNQVQISIQAASHQDSILGYEILRTMTSNGKAETRVVGFVPYGGETTVYTDTIATINNRVMGYQVKAVDKFLWYSNTADAGSQKISTKGNHEKSQWTVTGTMFSFDDVLIDPTMDDPDYGDKDSPRKTVKSINRIKDNDLSTEYGSPNPRGGWITFDLHQVMPVTSLIYYGTEIEGMEVYISISGSDWKNVKASKANVSDGDTIWLDSAQEEDRDKWIGTYDARFVRLYMPKGAFKIREIEICGPTGDNLEFFMAEGQPSMGILSQECSLGVNKEGEETFIPKGSLVITGEYKGNPAYNVVMVYDSDGNVLGSYTDEDGNKGARAEQVIFAPVPENGNLGEVSSGTWVYYLEPGYWNQASLPTWIRAELYRVDDALTNAGERIVSDTALIRVLETLPEITLTNNTQ